MRDYLNEKAANNGSNGSAQGAINLENNNNPQSNSSDPDKSVTPPLSDPINGTINFVRKFDEMSSRLRQSMNAQLYEMGA